MLCGVRTLHLRSLTKYDLNFTQSKDASAHIPILATFSRLFPPGCFSHCNSKNMPQDSISFDISNKSTPQQFYRFLASVPRTQTRIQCRQLPADQMNSTITVVHFRRKYNAIMSPAIRATSLMSYEVPFKYIIIFKGRSSVSR
jgi:hypothetical protein